jgi:hypothetical protein
LKATSDLIYLKINKSRPVHTGWRLAKLFLAQTFNGFKIIGGYRIFLDGKK